MRDTASAHPAVATPKPGDDDAALYRQLLRTARTTGKCPVWFGPAALSSIEIGRAPDDPVGRISGLDADKVLAGWWPGPCPLGCRCRAPFLDAFPGLVRADGRSCAADAASSAAVADFADAAAGAASLAVVDAVRPADIPAVLGWTGPCNYQQDLASLSAVLRSWEDRFGAVLTWLSGATLLLAVADPPTSVAESERVAAEHVAFCPDQRDPQDGRPPFTPHTYARTIRGASAWRFWWD